jgi:hypothetical protein
MLVAGGGGAGPGLLMQGISGRLLLQLEAGASSQDGQQMGGIEVRHLWLAAGLCNLVTF